MPESLCAAATEHFARRTGWDLVPSQWQPGERQRIEELASGKYAQSAWNRKR